MKKYHIIKRILNRQKHKIVPLILSSAFVFLYSGMFSYAVIGTKDTISETEETKYIYTQTSALQNNVFQNPASGNSIPENESVEAASDVKVPNEEKTEAYTEPIPENTDTEPYSLFTDSGLTVSGYNSIKLYNTKKGMSETIPLEEYVTGALLAEMPTSYHKEALMAQAVACRTYAVYKMIGNTYHADGSNLCTSPGHCQAYAEKDSVSEERYEKARSAVRDTENTIMFHGTSPILAVFHSSSGKKTASSAEIWGGTLPYLSSVDTGEVYNSEMSVSKDYYYTKEEFVRKLSALVPSLSGYTDDEILGSLTVTRTSSGRAESVNIFGNDVSAGSFVNAFSLRSKDFVIYHDSDGVCITCYGYGHGVGLSQHGAQDMAQKGYSCFEILSHYYTGISFGYVK